MSLFGAPKNAVLVHACNAQGVWGSGIAAEFKKRYPRAFERYKNVCTNTGFGFWLFQEKGDFHRVGVLITSNDYGQQKDPKEVIKINTTLALQNFLDKGPIRKSTIYSNKFNSGLFAVPWEETELILKTILKRYPNITWVVCDPNHVGD